MRSSGVKWLVVTIAILAIVAVAFLGWGAFWAGHVAAERYAGAGSGWNGGGMMSGWYGSGMMGGYGYSGSGSAAGQRSPAGSSLTMEQARQAVERYVAASGNPDLVLDEVMEFEGSFYAIVKEKSTGIGAFEVLVDKWSGAVSPEPGPNMMWNTRYGMMGGYGGGGMMGGWYGGGMMGGYGGGGMMGGYGNMMGRGFGGGYAQPNGTMPVTAAQAASIGQRWLDQNLPGVQVHADDVDPFYGYYTLHVWKDGRIYGMLSVNGASGQVWYHTWHGTFIAMQEG